MTTARHISVGNLTIGNDKPLTIIAGPCAMESRGHAMDMSGALKEIADGLGIGLIYKSSFDKANRSSVSNDRGVGLDKAMDIFQDVKKATGLPVLTDVHSPEHCAVVAEVVDVLQTPALLSRQTDLLLAAGETGKAVNVKKGQFMAPWDMANVAKKVESTGNMNVMLCERGTSFGYNTLVSDMRGLPEMAKTTCPVVFDATHSTQQPAAQGTSSGGDRRFAPVLARAAVSVGVAAVFMETHQDPDNAPCDGPVMIKLHEIRGIIEDLMAFDQLAKAKPVSI